MIVYETTLHWSRKGVEFITYRLLYGLQQYQNRYRMQATSIRGPEMIHVKQEKNYGLIYIQKSEQQKNVSNYKRFLIGRYLPYIEMHSVLHKMSRLAYLA